MGTLDSLNLVLTFVEGEFENSPTVSGSGFIRSQSEPSAYLVMNGTHNRSDRVFFSLYKIPLVGKEEFQLDGTLDHASISGSFTQFDNLGNQLRTGNWRVQRIP